MAQGGTGASGAKRVLVIKLSSLGDLFHALPAVHSLKVSSGAVIDWVTQTEYVDLVRCFTDVNRVIAFERRRFLPRLGAFLRDLRRDRYDLVIDLQGLLKSGLTAFLARGGERIGPPFHREGSALFYSRVAGVRRDGHAVARNLDVVRALGAEPLAESFPVRFPEYRLDGAGPRVAIVPSSRWASKNWPAASYGEVAAALKQLARASVYLVGSPADAAVCGEVARAAGGGVTDLAGRTSLLEMGGLLQRMDLVIGNDSGPIHMAAAVGTPVLAVFGPTDESRTGPYGPRHRVMADPALLCRPCFRRTCLRRVTGCMRGITPQAVTGAALEMLGLAPSAAG